MSPEEKKLSPRTWRQTPDLTQPVLPPCLSFGTSLHSQPLPGFLLLSFVSLSLFIPPMFIIFYEPTLLLHPGDATIREKEKNNVCILVRAMDRKQTQMSWLRQG